MGACMSSAVSEPGGVRVGAAGLAPEMAEQLCKEVGFEEFTLLDIGDPANLYYVVRP